jgi:hypothetical protein
MDVEPGYYDAMSARALCAAGKFVLCGKVLRPFSFRHSLQLDAVGNGLWAPGEEGAVLSDFLHAALVCSQTDFLTEFEVPTRRDLERFDREEAEAVWKEYLRVCYGSRPALWKSEGGSRSHCRAPIEEYVITAILRNAHGYTREWLETAPIGLVLWIFEAGCEQVSTRTRILTDEDKAEMERESSPKAVRARARREKIAGEIFKRVKDPGKRLKLLVDLDAGKLSKTWKSELRSNVAGSVAKIEQKRRASTSGEKTPCSKKPTKRKKSNGRKRHG